MRAMTAAIAVLCVCVPHVAMGQTSTGAPAPQDAEGERRHSVSLQAAGGPTLTLIGGGHVLSAAVGYSPVSRLELLVNIERNQVPAKLYGSSTRGGTLTFVSGEVRLALRPPDRVSPFAIIGAGRGVSRSLAGSPDRVRNDLRVAYLGGGVRVPLRRGFSLSADARCMGGVEGYDGVVALWPVRVGVAWRF